MTPVNMTAVITLSLAKSLTAVVNPGKSGCFSRFEGIGEGIIVIAVIDVSFLLAVPHFRVRSRIYAECGLFYLGSSSSPEDDAEVYFARVMIAA